MTGRVTSLWRYPIKSHGREAIEDVTLQPGQTMPWDRVWAVAHEQSKVDGAEWAPCQNFSRGSKAPGLTAISARLDEAAGHVTLSHPHKPDLTLNPDTDGDKLIEWTRDLMPANRAASARVVRGEERGFTDSDFASITLANMSSHRAVQERLGRELSINRWRANVFFDGLGPWEEFEWIDRELQLGEAVLIPRERTDRCLATHANPETGERDADILSALDTWGHRDFSVRAEVVKPGRVAIGDKVIPL